MGNRIREVMNDTDSIIPSLFHVPRRVINSSSQRGIQRTNVINGLLDRTFLIPSLPRLQDLFRVEGGEIAMTFSPARTDAVNRIWVLILQCIPWETFTSSGRESCQ